MKVLVLIIGIMVFLALVTIVLILLLRASRKNKERVTIIKSDSALGHQQSREQEKSYIETLQYDELTPVVNFIKRYHARGISALVIKEALLKKGWKIDQINKAFERAKINY